MRSVRSRFLASKDFDRALRAFAKKEDDGVWERNQLKAFVDECIQIDPDSELKASYLKEMYSHWARLNEEPDVSMVRLGRGLKGVFDNRRKSDGIYYLGVKERANSNQLYGLEGIESGEDSGQELTKGGVVRFIKEMWLQMHFPKELPEEVVDMSFEEAKAFAEKELKVRVKKIT